MAPMNYPRAFANSVVLPNGEVLTVGGENYAVPFSDATSVLNPEMWRSDHAAASPSWPRRPSPATTIPSRCCCPTAASSRAAAACAARCSTNHPDGQIFTLRTCSTPTARSAPAPTITSAPSAAQRPVQTITVTTERAGADSSMMRYGEATHSVDNDQRRIPLSIVSSNGNTYSWPSPPTRGSRFPARTCCSP